MIGCYVQSVRIGIVCVHGIGDQPRYKHSDSVARDLVKILSDEYGSDSVSVQTSPGLDRGAFRADTTIFLKRRSVLFEIDLIECWWRDLGERHGLKRIMRFWSWAITLWSSRRLSEEPSVGRVNPDVYLQKQDILRIFFTRIIIYLYSVLFFVLILPAHFVLNIASTLPFLARVNIFSTAYSYLSCVKIYVESKNDTVDDVVDLLVPKRVRIQSRLNALIAKVGASGYDSWIVLAHSLGSVVALKSIMEDGVAYANSLTADEWQNIDRCIVASTERECSNYFDKTPRKNWIPDGYCINLKAVYERFGGLITYGSPLHMFAKMWPSIIEINIEREFGKFPWINISNTLDPIAGDINFIDPERDGIDIHNFSFDEGYFVHKSHTKYFKRSNRSEDALILLIMKNIIESGKITGGELSVDRRPKRHGAITLQSIIAFATGFCILPAALASFGHLAASLIVFIQRAAGVDFILLEPLWRDPYSVSSLSVTAAIVFGGVFLIGFCRWVIRKSKKDQSLRRR